MKQNSGALFDKKGKRKYLTQQERILIEKAAEKFPREVRTLLGVLIFTGCRISEALNLTSDRIDLDDGVIVFESLKKRERGVFRAVPVPPKLLDMLELVHSVRETQEGGRRKNKVKLWDLSRATAWRRVKDVLDAAGVEQSTKMSPKSFRHGFGVAAVSAGIPLNLVQRWLGHAQLTTTAIYADAVGAEEKKIAERMW
jgi:integrase/recombinase XerD